MALGAALHEPPARNDQRRHPRSPCETIGAESFDMDQIQEIIALPLPYQRAVGPGAIRWNWKPWNLRWSSNRLAITTSALSVCIERHPGNRAAVIGIASASHLGSLDLAPYLLYIVPVVAFLG